MAGAKENLFLLTPLNFKEGKVNSPVKSPTVVEHLEKYDPLIFCRTCATVDPCLVPIFKEEGLDYSLNKKIEKYLPIQVSEEDDLPVHLCYHCASTLIAWDSLIVGCVEAEKKLISLKNSAVDKKCEEVIEDVGNLVDESIDSDDEPLLSKKAVIKIKKNEEKRDILQEKNDLQTLESIQVQSERRPKRKLTRQKKYKIPPPRIKDNETRDENIKDSRNKCSECGKTVLRSLKKHMKIHHNDKEKEVDVCYQCPICRKTYPDSSVFVEDLYSHLIHDLAEESDMWDLKVCKICKMTCENLEELPNHILLHMNSKTLKESNGRGIYRKKKKKEIQEEIGKLTCEICGKTISKKYALKRHLATHSGEKKFTCHHCGKQYAQESGLQRHMLVIHEGVRKYKCPICSEVFGSNLELKSHQDTHTDPRPFQCDQCGRTFISQKHLYHHRKYHHTANGMRQLCNICNRYFSSPSVLKRHHKVVHLGLKEFQCHVCSAQLSTKHYLQEHLRLHSDERPEVCSFCGKTFQVTGNLRQHLKTHMGKTQICYVCGKGFTRRCHLLIHMGSHRGFEHPQCEHCSQVFMLKSDLEKHMKKEHSGKISNLGAGGTNFSPDEFKNEVFKDSENPAEDSDDLEKEILDTGQDCSADWKVIPKTWLSIISCKHCGKISCAPKHLRQHERRGTCTKNFQCKDCGRLFAKEPSLLKHMKRHQKENLSDRVKRFSCSICNKKFKFEDNGLAHEKICGKTESIHKCSVCGKRFETKTLADQHWTSHHKSCVCHMCGQSFSKPESLKQHVKTVHEEFKMVCHYCGKEFSRKARLQEHLQHHTGQMDFTCHVCGKGSTNAYSFGVHLATHSQETPFSCSFCPRTFKHMKYVYLHERSVHLKLKSGKTYVKPKKPGKNVAQRTCPLCNKMFKRESAMLIHKRSVHEGKNGYICKLCGKDFKYTYLLYVHKKKHHFPELCKYMCEFCEKPFPVKTELQNHLRKHTGEKPYICGICGKTYSFHGSLNMHMKTQHENKKTFKCNICGSLYNFQSHLTRHLTVHIHKYPETLNTELRQN